VKIKYNKRKFIKNKNKRNKYKSKKITYLTENLNPKELSRPLKSLATAL